MLGPGTPQPSRPSRYATGAASEYAAAARPWGYLPRRERRGLSLAAFQPLVELLGLYSSASAPPRSDPRGGNPALAKQAVDGAQGHVGLGGRSFDGDLHGLPPFCSRLTGIVSFLPQCGH